MANMVHKSGAGSSLEGSWLESIYKQYGGHLYSLWLRLLGDKSKAEDATAEAFVRPHKEAVSPPDGSQVLPRLRELGIEASLRRLRAWGCRLGRFLYDGHMKRGRVRQP
jgi:DNA-directed RNA polymerase specialized sigma24 family protein